MKFTIITHVVHIKENDVFNAYAPYVREMNVWGKYVDEILLVAPISKNITSGINTAYLHKNIKFFKIPSISLTSLREVLKSIFYFPFIFSKVYLAMYKADHIHIRCPGNIGLIGCLVQILFPSKTKTAKYAGNWDPKAGQPLSYRFQKWLLSNTLLTRNMKALVYGDWSNQSKNIKPFFTASFSKEMIEEIGEMTFLPPFRFIFVGSLSPGKRPLYALQLVSSLLKKEINCRLDVFGEGQERIRLEKYIEENQLSDSIKLFGNQKAAVVVEAYKNSSFLLLPSQSEGWPKVIAEAMFFGVIPMGTNISCVPWMLGFGNRGILLDMDLDKDKKTIIEKLNDVKNLKEMSNKAQEWSHQYTLDRFETEINELL